MSSFDRVVVIFNPHSTRDAPRRAEDLRVDLLARVPGLRVNLKATERAGHARDLAWHEAAAGQPLIVSVSGDGGYNEVVNGVMRAGNPAAACAVLAAGNANDHRRATRERPLVDAIVAGDVDRIDLLRLSVGTGQKAVTRYAHSYIGLGLTSAVAVDLAKGDKGSLMEVITVVRSFAKFRPFDIRLEDGSYATYDSLLFANIAEMAKYARLSEAGPPDDGRFEVIALTHTSKWRIVAIAAKSAISGLGSQPTATHFAFTTVDSMPVQLDGEVVRLHGNTQVSVDIAPKALATVH